MNGRTAVRTRLQPRSWAWALGWLSLSGPFLEVVGNASSRFGAPLLPWVSILVDLWAVTSVLFGVAPIAVARDDSVPSSYYRPRSTSAGLLLGIVGLALSACLVLLWLLTPLSF